MNKIKIQINISKRVFEEIDAQKIEPRPRWHFIIQETGIWFLGVSTTLLGAVAFSTILFVLVVAPHEYQAVTHTTTLQFWIDFLPVLWFVLFLCFIVATDYFLKKTKRGYKHSFVVLTLSSMTLSLVLGYIGFLAGIGEMVEKDLGQNIPFHSSVTLKTRQIWSNPQNGLVTGRIGTNESVFVTSQGKTLVLDAKGLSQMQQDLLTSREYVGLIGTSTAPNIFMVCLVVPFEKPEFKIESNQFERNDSQERTNICKGVRPYMRLQANILK